MDRTFRWLQSTDDLPTGPFYLGVEREDRIPVAPVSKHGDGLSFDADPRPAAGPPTLHIGDHVGAIPLVREDPERVGARWPLRLYELRGTVGLRWEIREWHRDGDRSFRRLVADDAVVLGEVPSWRYFGPYGEAIPDLLEELWALDPERIDRLALAVGGRWYGRKPVPSGVGTIPISLLDVPEADRGASNAAFEVTDWAENKSWAAGSRGGGFFYRSGMFTYIVSEESWLMAMGIACNAAIALARGPGVPTRLRTTALAAWAELTRD